MLIRTTADSGNILVTPRTPVRPASPGPAAQLRCWWRSSFQVRNRSCGVTGGARRRGRCRRRRVAKRAAPVEVVPVQRHPHARPAAAGGARPRPPHQPRPDPPQVEHTRLVDVVAEREQFRRCLRPRLGRDVAVDRRRGRQLLGADRGQVERAVAAGRITAGAGHQPRADPLVEVGTLRADRGVRCRGRAAPGCRGRGAGTAGPRSSG